MKKSGIVEFWAVLFAGVLLTTALVNSHTLQLIVNDSPTTTAFVGSGDIKAAFAYTGLRAYSSATRGNKAINVCNAADANCVDFLTNATTGNLVAQSVGATDCTAVNTCTIKTWYDQTNGNHCSGGSCDATQATISKRLTLTWNCVGGKPCGVAVRASNQFAVSSGTMGAADGYAFAIRTGSTTSVNYVIDYELCQMYYAASANTAGLTSNGGTITLAAADNSWHSLASHCANGGSALLCVDATNTTGTTGASNIATGFGPASWNSDPASLDGKWFEGAAYLTVVTATDCTNLNSNVRTYLGI